MGYEILPATPEVWPLLDRLFGRAGASNGCWCMYWLLGPEYHRRDRTLNREELRSSMEAEPPPGLLALDMDSPDAATAVGWVRLTPRSQLSRLNRTRFLDPVDDLPVWSVPCFFVARSHRGRGVSDALLGAAVEATRAAGAPAVEGYPVDLTVPGATRNAFTGHVPVFERNGFTEVARRRQSRPIMRRMLRSGFRLTDHRGPSDAVLRAIHRCWMSGSVGCGTDIAAGYPFGVTGHISPPPMDRHSEFAVLG